MTEFSFTSTDDKKKETWWRGRRPEFNLHLPFLSQTIIMVLKAKYNKVKTFKFFLMSLCIYKYQEIYIYLTKLSNAFWCCKKTCSPPTHLPARCVLTLDWSFSLMILILFCNPPYVVCIKDVNWGNRIWFGRLRACVRADSDSYMIIVVPSCDCETVTLMNGVHTVFWFPSEQQQFVLVNGIQSREYQWRT